jgi:flagellar hook-associated protein 2
MVTAKYDATAGKLSFSDTSTGSATVTVAGASFGSLVENGTNVLSSIYTGTESSITINGVSVAFNKDTDSMASLVTKINSSKAGVTAVLDAASGKMSLTNKATGGSAITVGGTLGDQLFQSSGYTTGSDALVTINGIETSQSSNRFTINGVEISISGVTPTDQTSQIEISQDLDGMVETIKAFVESYNATLSAINSKLSEERYRTYLPLTSDQRDAMDEDEIELWETKAKSGMLKSDSILNSQVSSMRTALSSDVVMPDGTKVNLAQFGITTGTYSEKGKLYIDETMLRTALESNPEGATALFGQTTTTSSGSKELYSTSDGLFSRIKKVNNVSLTQLYERAGTSRYSSDLTTAFMSQSTMGLQLTDYEKRIQEWEDRLVVIENRYYSQFTAMETAMNKYSSVSSSLTSMLS